MRNVGRVVLRGFEKVVEALVPHCADIVGAVVGVVGIFMTNRSSAAAAANAAEANVQVFLFLRMQPGD